MNIRDLEYFVALAELGHFQKAAEACNVSQPTLSTQIRKLENELGGNLLERSSRKVSPTRSGRVLVEQAKAVLRELNSLKKMAIYQKEPLKGPLHIGIIPTLSSYLVTQIMPIFCKKFPNIELFLYEKKTDQLLELLYNGKIDCAIMPSVAQARNFCRIKIFEEPLYLTVNKNHPFANRSSFSMSQLKGEKIMILDEGNCLRWQVESFCEFYGAEEDKHLVAKNLDTLHSMVICNRGITFLPLLAITPHKEVEYLACDDPIAKRSIKMITRLNDPMQFWYEQIMEEFSLIHVRVVKNTEKELLYHARSIHHC